MKILTIAVSVRTPDSSHHYGETIDVKIPEGFSSREEDSICENAAENWKARLLCEWSYADHIIVREA